MDGQICARMRNFRLSRLTGSTKPWMAFINMALIYSRKPLESKSWSSAADKRLLLSATVPPRLPYIPACFLHPDFISFSEFPAGLLPSTVVQINRWHSDVSRAHERHFVKINWGCGQQCKHFMQAIWSAKVACWTPDEYRTLLKGISSVHVPAAYRSFRWKLVCTIQLQGALTFSSACQKIFGALLQVSSNPPESHHIKTAITVPPPPSHQNTRTPTRTTTPIPLATHQKTSTCNESRKAHVSAGDILCQRCQKHLS